METIQSNPWILVQQPIPSLIIGRPQGHLVKGLAIQAIAAQIAKLLSDFLVPRGFLHNVIIYHSRTVISVLYAKVALNMGNAVTWLRNDKPLVQASDAARLLVGCDKSKIDQAFKKAEKLVADLLSGGNALVTLGTAALGLSLISDSDALSPWLPFSTATLGTLSLLMGLGSWMLVGAIACESGRKIPAYQASLPFPGLTAYTAAFLKMQGLLWQGKMKTEPSTPPPVKSQAASGKLAEVPKPAVVLKSKEDSEFYCSTYANLWSTRDLALIRLTSEVKSKDYKDSWKANYPAKVKLDGGSYAPNDYSYVHRAVKSHGRAREAVDEILSSCEECFTKLRTHLEQTCHFKQADLANEIATSSVREGFQEMALFMPLKQLVEVYYMVRSSYGPQCHLSKEHKAIHILRGEEPGLCNCISQDTRNFSKYKGYDIDKQPGRLESEMVFYKPGTPENRWRETFNRVIAKNADLWDMVIAKNKSWQGWLQQDQLNDMKFHLGRIAKLPPGNAMKDLI